jgi:4-hydroxybenzoate polyprenyltransferase
MTTEPARRAPGQWRSLFQAVHPKQAVAVAVVVGALVALMGRPPREVGVSAAAVLLAQLIMGLVNDLCDVELDRASGAPRKPIASGHLPQGNASFAVAVLTLLVIPLALQNGLLAGAFLLATLVLGLVHNRWLHRTALSFVGWAGTFALLAAFVTWGGWGQDADGSAPYPAFVALVAALGVMVHFLTSLPDLVHDNLARVRHLPLRVALRTGAPRLLVISVVLTIAVVAVLVYDALTVGIAA